MKDLIIIGAGPIGLSCGIEAKKNNLEYLIIDKGMLVNSIFHYPTNTTFFSTSDKLEIGDIPFISHNVKPTRTEALEYYRRVSNSWELNLSLYNEVLKIKNENDYFSITTQNGKFESRNIVICTGFYDIPYLLNIPGENLDKVLHYYNESHPYYQMDIAIVGAGNSAVDVALDTYRKGAKSVTMVIRENEVGENIKYWVKPDIMNRINNKEIQAYFNSEITEHNWPSVNKEKIKKTTEKLLLVCGDKTKYMQVNHSPCQTETWSHNLKFLYVQEFPLKNLPLARMEMLQRY